MPSNLSTVSPFMSGNTISGRKKRWRGLGAFATPLSIVEPSEASNSSLRKFEISRFKYIERLSERGLPSLHHRKEGSSPSPSTSSLSLPPVPPLPPPLS